MLAFMRKGMCGTSGGTLLLFSVTIPILLAGAAGTFKLSHPDATAATARLQGAYRPPICVLVARKGERRTIAGTRGATVDISDCLVRVSGTNGDGAETREQPPVSEARAINKDPFAAITVPSGTCTATDAFVREAGASLSPGTFCGGLELRAKVTLKPGLYVIKDGPLKISGTYTDVDATGVTFVLTGDKAGLVIDTAGWLRFSAAGPDDAGPFAGFAFYLDPKTATGTSMISSAKVAIAGVTYLAGQTLKITDGADVRIDGAIVADDLLPEESVLKISGRTATPNLAFSAMQRQTDGSSPIPAR